MHAEELIGLWESGPYDFGATESTSLALLADGRGWTSVAANTPAGAGSTADPAGSARAARPMPTRVRRLSWDCPKPGVLEVRYELAIDLAAGRRDPDYEFIRAQYTLLPDRPDRSDESALHLSQHVDSARQFALARREISADDDPAKGLASPPAIGGTEPPH